jgi:hypothetical protein
VGSNSKKRQSFAKLARERAVKEKRERKQAKKDDRRQADLADGLEPAPGTEADGREGGVDP